MDKQMLSALVDLFRLQRCGCACEDPVYAHPACHTSPAAVYGTNEKRDVSGGWHDAGDYGRYTVPGAKAVIDLLAAYRIAPDAFIGIPVLEEARYELEWLLKMHREDGAAYHKVTCADFCGFIMPEEEREPLFLSPVSTAATADLAAALTIGALSFRVSDPAFSERCREAALKACRFLDTAPLLPFKNPEGIVTGEYPEEDGSLEDELFLAAAAEYALTWEEAAAKKAEKRYENGLPLLLGWAGVAGYGALLLHDLLPECPFKERLRRDLDLQAEDLLRASEADEWGLSLKKDFPWGSNMNVCHNGVLLAAGYLRTGNMDLRRAAEKHYAYLLGANPLKRSYVTGFGPNPPVHPHHRLSAAKGVPAKGMLVGGPDKYLHDPLAMDMLGGKKPEECYLDKLMSYSTNEIAIYWNSALVLFMAVLSKS